MNLQNWHYELFRKRDKDLRIHNISIVDEVIDLIVDDHDHNKQGGRDIIIEFNQKLRNFIKLR